MIRGLIIVKAAHVEEARTLAQQPPFSATPEAAAAFLVPANPVYAEDGMTITTPATLYWASGEFDPAFWDGIVQAAAALEWGGAWEYDIDKFPDYFKNLSLTSLPAEALPDADGLGTLYGLDNAGTVYDAGGNVSNNKTGAGSIIVPTL